MAATYDPVDARALLDAARGLSPTILSHRDAIEQDRRLPLPLVQALAEAGLFRMCVPRSLGGGEVDPATLLRAIEEVSRHDGATAWCVMIGASTALLAGVLPEAAAAEVYGAGPTVVTGGSLNPQAARAVAVDGGYRATGRWGFGSGSQHCQWLVGNCVVFDGDAPRLTATGTPETRVLFFPAGEVQIIDTWSVGGLRGTGSHDFAVADVFVPADRAVDIAAPPAHPGPLYAFPILGLLAAAVAAVPLGIARGAIDALVELAAGKTPLWSGKLLRERPMVQTQVAQAEALLRSARAFLLEAVEETWQAVKSGQNGTLQQRALLRLAAVNACVASAQAVDLMHTAAGSTALFTTSPLERAFRDVHAATQHALVQPVLYEPAGRALLGMDAGTSLL